MSRKKAEPAHAGTGHTCGECSKGDWNMNCFDYQCKPFLIYCEHTTYAYSRRAGSPVTMSHIDACQYFAAGERKTQ